MELRVSRVEVIDEVLRRAIKKNVKLKTNVVVVEGEGEREVELISRSPVMEFGRVKVKVPAKVKKVTRFHNTLTQEGLYWYAQTFAQAMYYIFQYQYANGSPSAVPPPGFTNNTPPFPAMIMLYTNQGQQIGVQAIVIPQVVTPTTAIIYIIASYTPTSNTVISKEELYLYMGFAGSNVIPGTTTCFNYRIYTNLVKMAYANVNISMNANQTYQLIWEIEIVNNFTLQTQYNTITWMAFLFVNTLNVISNTVSPPGTSFWCGRASLQLLSTSGSQQIICSQQLTLMGYNQLQVITFLTQNNIPTVAFLFVLNNPGLNVDITGLVGYAPNGLLSNGQGCSLVVIDNISYLVQSQPSQNPILTLPIVVQFTGTT